MNFIRKLFIPKDYYLAKRLMSKSLDQQRKLKNSNITYRIRVSDLSAEVSNLKSENSALKKQIKELQECKSKLRRYESRRLNRR